MSQAQADALAKKLLPLWKLDELFFKRRPDRQYRVRRAFPEEIELCQRAGYITQSIPDDLRVYFGVRLEGSPRKVPTRKVFGFLPPDAETDLDEQDARRVFFHLETHGERTLTAHAALNRAAASSSNGGSAA